MFRRHRVRDTAVVVSWLVASSGMLAVEARETTSGRTFASARTESLPRRSDAAAASPVCTPFPFRDEGPRRPDFVAFRRELIAAIDRRDIEAVVRVAVPEIRLSFGTDGGTDELRQRLARDAEGWEALRTLLTLGGKWESPDAFTAPYVTSAWPEPHDAFDEQAIVGTHVRVRAAPRPDAAILTSLSDCIITVAVGQAYHADWVPVDLGPRRIGWVSGRHIRSPIDYRAGFLFEDGRWQMTFFLAGD